VSPNLSRIVNEWGLGPVLDRNAVRLSAIVVKRWKDGKVLVVAPAMPKIEQVHGAPQYVVHRPELLNTFLEGGLALPTVTLRTNAHVEKVDFDAPSVTLRGGETHTADVVIAADGLKSVCRALLFGKLGLVDKARPTGDAAYRIVIPAEDLLADQTLKHLIADKPVGYFLPF
jgi:salicylate hydroxylase